MGFFDFMKGAGKRLGFGGNDEENAEALKKELDSHNLGTEAVRVEVKGDTAIVKGAVANQEAFEKAVVALGNTDGIAKVQADDLKVVPPESSLKLDASADINAIIAAATPATEPKFHTVESGDRCCVYPISLRPDRHL